MCILMPIRAQQGTPQPPYGDFFENPDFSRVTQKILIFMSFGGFTLPKMTLGRFLTHLERHFFDTICLETFFCKFHEFRTILESPDLSGHLNIIFFVMYLICFQFFFLFSLGSCCFLFVSVFFRLFLFFFVFLFYTGSLRDTLPHIKLRFCF